MLLNNLTALFIYNTSGEWFFPHTLAVVTLVVLIPGIVAVRFFKGYKYWLPVHMVSFVVSYYMLIGGAINEAFLRIPFLMPYNNPDSWFGLSHFGAQFVFIGLIVYFLNKYKRGVQHK